MTEQTAPWMQPVFFRRNRVFRVYLGGKLFHEFLGDPDEDGNLPEEWICSAVRAINPGHTDPLEGISLREEDGMPFDRILAAHPEEYLGGRENIGVLVKYLDSAIRLPMQAHPTREFSRKSFGSPYGKAESWLILATRPGACLYFGFDRRVSKEEFSAAVERSEADPEAMTAFVNRIPVRPGDVFFVGAGVIHAIGAGCLLLEVQEPTDFTIQPEHWCGDYRLSDREMYLGLPKDTFTATVDRYNELAAKGEDEDYGKEDYRLSTLSEAPFYGVRQAGGYLICTIDGIQIDDNMHAIDQDFKAIPGLYVIGDMSGNYFSGSYPCLMAGVAMGRTLTFAMKSIKQMAGLE